MSWSFIPTTTTLCASCATVEASAPLFSPNPRTKPEADPAGPEVALDHRDLGEVAFGVGDCEAVDDGGLLDERLGHDLVGDDPDHARGTAVPGDREMVGRDGADPDRVLDPLGHLGPRDLLDRPSRA